MTSRATPAGRREELRHQQCREHRDGNSCPPRDADQAQPPPDDHEDDPDTEAATPSTSTTDTSSTRRLATTPPAAAIIVKPMRSITAPHPCAPPTEDRSGECAEGNESGRAHEAREERGIFLREHDESGEGVSANTAPDVQRWEAERPRPAWRIGSCREHGFRGRELGCRSERSSSTVQRAILRARSDRSSDERGRHRCHRAEASPGARLVMHPRRPQGRSHRSPPRPSTRTAYRPGSPFRTSPRHVPLGAQVHAPPSEPPSESSTPRPARSPTWPRRRRNGVPERPGRDRPDRVHPPRRPRRPLRVPVRSAAPRLVLGTTKLWPSRETPAGSTSSCSSRGRCSRATARACAQRSTRRRSPSSASASVHRPRRSPTATR